MTPPPSSAAICTNAALYTLCTLINILLGTWMAHLITLSTPGTDRNYAIAIFVFTVLWAVCHGLQALVLWLCARKRLRLARQLRQVKIGEWIVSGLFILDLVAVDFTLLCRILL